MTFENRIAWITGASSGIGEALAYALADRGARLVLSARREDELRRVQAACAHPDRHLVLPLDLADTPALPEKVQAVLDHFGRVDLLVNNGGIGQRALAADTDLSVDRRIMEINYFGTIALTKAVLPSMLARGEGHIAVISSLTGKFGVPGRTAYSASKHALHGFFDGLRAEVHDAGIRVTLVCPGYVRTDISRNALTGTGSPHHQMDRTQQFGIAPEVCARKTLRAIEREKAEVWFGKTEVAAVYLKRFAPPLLRRILRNRVPRPRRQQNHD